MCQAASEQQQVHVWGMHDQHCACSLATQAPAAAIAESQQLVTSYSDDGRVPQSCRLGLLI